MLLPLLTFLLTVGIGLFLAREKLSPSYFRGFFFFPWGCLRQTPWALDKVLSTNKKLLKISQTNQLPADIRKVSPAHLATIHNRDQLTRPLAGTLIDMALRGLIVIHWRKESEEFVLTKKPASANQQPTKADRAILAKLFPNEATELPIDWRHGDILGDTRRLLEKAYVPKSLKYRLALGMPLGPAMLVGLFIAIIIMIKTSDAGFVSVLLPLMVVAWPTLLLWTFGQTVRAKRLYDEVKSERFQARLFIFAAITLGLLVSALINVLVLIFAFGLIRGLLMIILGCLLAVTVAWLRPAKNVGKPHELSASYTYGLINNGQQESDPTLAAKKLSWATLAHAYALGAEDFWMATGKLKMDISDAPDEDDLNDEENQEGTPAESAKDEELEDLQKPDLNPDNIVVTVPAGLDFGRQEQPLQTVHQLLANGFLFDLWISLQFNHLTNFKSDFENYRKLTVKQKPSPGS